MRRPATPTDDLRHRLEEILSFRAFGPVEVYAVFAEWCEENGVEPPRENGVNSADSSKTIYEDLSQTPEEWR